MKEFISHFSAAAMWNIPYYEAAVGAGAALVEVTVSGAGERWKGAGRSRIVHLCELELPKGSVVMHDGVRVASPELTFLQLADRLDIQRLILLGLQMCSHPSGEPSKALTTKVKMNAFLEKVSGHRGWRKAKRAVKYIENGSASIMESLVYMMLALPHTLGGYGLDGVVFNHEIGLEGEARKRLGQERCFLDLYYKRSRLAVEYDSYAYHSGPAAYGKDALRAATIERHGVEVIRLSTIQVYNSAAFKDLVFNIAARLEKRVRIRTNRFAEMQGSLQALLPVRPKEE